MSETSGGIGFSRTLTFGVLLTLFIQTGSGLIWIGTTNARLHAVEAQLSHSLRTNERLAVVEGQMSMIRDSLNRIEKQVTSNAIEAERRP